MARTFKDQQKNDKYKDSKHKEFHGAKNHRKVKDARKPNFFR